MTTIGARVREIRLARGLSQQSLSGDGISAGYVSLIESGQRNPSPAMLERLASRLGVAVDDLVEVARPVASEHVRLEVNFARLALANGNAAEAVSCLGRLDLTHLDSATACDASFVLAEGFRLTAELDRAAGVLEALVQRCRDEQSWLTAAKASTLLAIVYIESGDADRSIEVSLRVLREVEAAALAGTDEHIRLGSVLVSALFERGDLLFATRQVQQLIDIADRVGSTRARGSVYWTAATVAHERGQVAEALQLTDRAVGLLGEQDGSRDLPRLRLNYACILLSQTVPEPERAIEQLDRAESDAALSASRLDLGTAATFRGRAHLLLGEVYDAAEHAARALQLLGPSEHIERASALILLGDVGVAQRDHELAHESYGEAERVLTAMKPSRAVARLWRELGDSLREMGDLQATVAAYNTSLALLGVAARPESAFSQPVRRLHAVAP